MSDLSPSPRPPARPSPRVAQRSAGAVTQIRSLLWKVYLPTFLLSVGQGLVIANVPLFARELGADLGLVGMAVAAAAIGRMAFDVPAGVVVSRLGRKRTMAIGSAALGVFAVLAGLSGSVLQLIALRFAAGAAMSLWSISRHAYIADTVPVHMRGRVLSLFGGVSRVATIIGPIAGGVLAVQMGLRAPFIAQGLVALFTVVIFLALMEESGERVAIASGREVFARVGRTVTAHRRDFMTAGVAAVAMQLVRNGRRILIPLWGDAMGLDPGAIGVIVGASAAVDSTLFIPVGIIVDRWGRKWVFVPSLIVLGSSLMLIPLAHTYLALMAAALLAGLGNGMGSGIVFTLGVDLSPRAGRGEFLGVWRLISDSGGAAGPFIVGSVAQIVSLGTAAVATGSFGFAGALYALLLVKETLVRRGTRR